jgi:hypothetical protein
MPRHRARSQKPDQQSERCFQSNSSAPEHPEHKDRTRYEQHGTQDEQAIAQSSSRNASLLPTLSFPAPRESRSPREGRCPVTYDCRESRWNVSQRAQRQSLPAAFAPRLIAEPDIFVTSGYDRIDQRPRVASLATAAKSAFVGTSRILHARTPQ